MIMENDIDSDKFHEISDEASDMLNSLVAAILFHILDGFGNWDVFTGYSSRLQKCCNAFDAFYQKFIDEHLDPERPKPEQEDLIDILLALQRDQSAGATHLTNSHIKGILMAEEVVLESVWGAATIELALANSLYSFNWELPSGVKNKEDTNMEETFA